MLIATRRHVWQHTTKSSVFFTLSKDAIIVVLLSSRRYKSFTSCYMAALLRTSLARKCVRINPKRGVASDDIAARRLAETSITQPFTVIPGLTR